MIQLCFRYLLVWRRPPVKGKSQHLLFIKPNFIESMSPTHFLLNFFILFWREYVSSPGRACSLNNAATNLMQVLILKLGCLQSAKGVPKTNKSFHWTLKIWGFCHHLTLLKSFISSDRSSYSDHVLLYIQQAATFEIFTQSIDAINV